MGFDRAVPLIIFAFVIFYIALNPLITTSSPPPPPRPSDNAVVQALRLEVNQLRETEELVKLSLEEAHMLRDLSKQSGKSTSPDSLPAPTPNSQISTPSNYPVPPPSPDPPASYVSSPQETNYLSYLSSTPNDPSRPVVNVLLYNKFEGYLDWWREADFTKPARELCSTVCTVTKDRSTVGTADVVLFHVKTHSKGDFPARVDGGQKWGYVSLEQPGYAPLINDKSYTSRFDYSLTYDLDSSIPTITVSPHFTAEQYHAAEVLPFSQKDGFGSPNAIAAFVSNCNAAGAGKRQTMMQELSKYMPLHSYGSCMHNHEEPSMPGCKAGDRACNKQKVLRRYKFYLSFENDVIKDYVSEKVFDGLLGGTLPVYRGAESIDMFMPSDRSKAVVKMSDFGDDMKALAEYLLELADNEEEYNKYFEWKKEVALDRFQGVLDMTAYKYTSLCRICEKVHNDKVSL
ncbi:hypothetical protein TrCOL_g196 [Triparma columacea]|uniref:Fucosyltransferase n=1 Tax=Triparma columacea TaxID=722753 RepID=A0A9W7LBU8_9STRA|nr:hypothetical protein TrCOL_g196 [Triparma columacea]